MEQRRTRWSYPTKLTISLLVLAFVLYLLSQFSAVIVPFILAVILAYIISPIANFISSRLRFNRILAILLAYLLLILIASAIPLVLIPSITIELQQVNLDYKSLYTFLSGLRGTVWHIAGQTIQLNGLIDQAVKALQGFLEPVVSHTLGLVVEIFTSIVWIIFIFIVSFYLVKDSSQVIRWIESLYPPDFRDDFLRLQNEISVIWSSFFRGQLLLGFVVACIFIVIGFVLGLPFALMLGLLAGLLEFLPSIGHGIWMTIAGVLTFSLGSTWLPLPNWVVTLILIGLHIAFSQIDLNYLIPRIIGRSVHLPPLVVILGIVAGAVMAGVIGIPLAAPTIASIRVVGRYIYANIFDLDPFPSDLSMLN